MCGIAGLVDSAGLDRDEMEPRLVRALQRLTPRGPDDRQLWVDSHCALAHARLAVIDLSREAAQPMTRRNLTICYNGLSLIHI